jgi:hypothetical protein
MLLYGATEIPSYFVWLVPVVVIGVDRAVRLVGLISWLIYSLSKRDKRRPRPTSGCMKRRRH